MKEMENSKSDESLNLKSEIGKWTGRLHVQSEFSDFGFEIQGFVRFRIFHFPSSISVFPWQRPHPQPQPEQRPIARPVHGRGNNSRKSIRFDGRTSRNPDRHRVRRRSPV